MKKCSVSFDILLTSILFLVCPQSPEIQMTKVMAAMSVYTTKKCNYNSIVIVHQHGGHDFTGKQRITT